MTTKEDLIKKRDEIGRMKVGLKNLDAAQESVAPHTKNYNKELYLRLNIQALEGHIRLSELIVEYNTKLDEFKAGR